MPSTNKISVRQLTVLVILLTIGDSILVLAPVTTFYAKQDAWISGLIGLAIGLIGIYIFSSAGMLYPKLTIVQSIQKILGKWLGTCVAIIFLIHPFTTILAFTAEIGNFLTAEMMPETPSQAIRIMFMCIVVFAVRLGLEVIARTGELFIPGILLFFFLLVVLLSPQLNFDNLKPILENGIKPALHGSISFIAFPFMEMVVLLMIFPYVNSPQYTRKAMIHGALIGGIILIIVILISILVLGADLTTRSLYPSYSLARTISVGNFIERVEAIVALIWLLTIFMNTSIFFYALVLGISQLLKFNGYRMLTLPIGMLLIILSEVISPNIIYYNEVVSKYWPYFDLSYGMLLPLLLLSVYYIKKKWKGIT